MLEKFEGCGICRILQERGAISSHVRALTREPFAILSYASLFVASLRPSTATRALFGYLCTVVATIRMLFVVKTVTAIVLPDALDGACTIQICLLL
jgi:hypothetical protein